MVPQTRISLLLKLRDHSESESWEEFVSIYGPLISVIARRCGVSDDDVQDVEQAVLLQMTHTLKNWEKDETKGRFRNYLSKVTASKIANHYRKHPQRTASLDDANLVVDPKSLNVEELFDEELERQVMNYAIRKVREESKPELWECFSQHVLNRVPAKSVSERLKITETAVYTNCSRTMGKVREIANRIAPDLMTNNELPE